MKSQRGDSDARDRLQRTHGGRRWLHYVAMLPTHTVRHVCGSLLVVVGDIFFERGAMNDVVAGLKIKAEKFDARN